MDYYKQQIKSLLKNISKKTTNKSSEIYLQFINQVDLLDDITLCELYSILTELNKNNNNELLINFSNKLIEYT